MFNVIVKGCVHTHNVVLISLGIWAFLWPSSMKFEYLSWCISEIIFSPMYRLCQRCLIQLLEVSLVPIYTSIIMLACTLKLLSKSQ